MNVAPQIPRRIPLLVVYSTERAESALFVRVVFKEDESMAGIAGTGSVASTAQIQTQFQVSAVKRLNDATKLEGDLALQLINSAVSADPAVGSNLNVKV